MTEWIERKRTREILYHTIAEQKIERERRTHRLNAWVREQQRVKSLTDLMQGERDEKKRKTNVQIN